MSKNHLAACKIGFFFFSIFGWSALDALRRRPLHQCTAELGGKRHQEGSVRLTQFGKMQCYIHKNMLECMLAYKLERYMGELTIPEPETGYKIINTV
jgi:hypothetical protein